jgi:hypothetical protein
LSDRHLRFLLPAADHRLGCRLDFVVWNPLLH